MLKDIEAMVTNFSSNGLPLNYLVLDENWHYMGQSPSAGQCSVPSPVQGLRHHFGPSLRDVWALYHPTHAVIEQPVASTSNDSAPLLIYKHTHTQHTRCAVLYLVSMLVGC